jgi:hypothetical protein
MVFVIGIFSYFKEEQEWLSAISVRSYLYTDNDNKFEKDQVAMDLVFKNASIQMHYERDIIRNSVLAYNLCV